MLHGLYNHVAISICCTRCRAIYDLSLGCVTLACAAFVPSLFRPCLLCSNCTGVTAVPCFLLAVSVQPHSTVPTVPDLCLCCQCYTCSTVLTLYHLLVLHHLGCQCLKLYHLYLACFTSAPIHTTALHHLRFGHSTVYLCLLYHLSLGCQCTHCTWHCSVPPVPALRFRLPAVKDNRGFISCENPRLLAPGDKTVKMIKSIL